MVEGLVKDFLIEQKIDANLGLAVWTAIDCAPDCEQEGEKSDLSHCVLAENHSLAHVDPEVRIDEARLREMCLLVADNDWECFFQEVAKSVASEMVVSRDAACTCL